MSAIKGVSKLAQAGVRQVHSSPRLAAQQCFKYSEVSPKLKAKQALFQADNDLPVFLKGGAMDNILYRVTMGLCVIGYGWSMSFFISQAVPKTE